VRSCREAIPSPACSPAPALGLRAGGNGFFIVPQTDEETAMNSPHSPRLHLEQLEERNCPSASYTVLDLGTLGGTGSYAYAINNATKTHDVQVVGFSSTGTQGDAFLWTKGGTDGVTSNPQMKDLGTLGGTQTQGGVPSSEGNGINDAGQVVGEAYTAGGGAFHAFLWTNSQMKDLGTLGGNNSIAYGINPTSSDGVQVVGVSDTVSGQHAFLWTQNGGMTDLGIGPGTAFAINDAGQVVGFAGTGTQGHAFLWQNGVMTDLGTLGGNASFARAINANGQVAGHSYLKNGTEFHAFRWTPKTPNGTTGKMADLGALNNLGTFKDSAAYGINDSGYVVGNSGTGVPPNNAFYWPGSGPIQKLSDLVPDNSMYLDTAAGINNTGQIAVYQLGGLNPHSFLLTPTSSTVQIGSFTASPNSTTTGSLVTLTAANVTTRNVGSTITQVTFYVRMNGVDTLLGYGTQPSSGAWTMTFTVNLASGSYTLVAQAEDSSGAFSDPLTLSLTVL
jgi:probable HAF family extracellular repeat protein